MTVRPLNFVSVLLHRTDLIQPSGNGHLAEIHFSGFYKQHDKTWITPCCRQNYLIM